MKIKKIERRTKIRSRIRAKLSGTNVKPRVSVFRSLKHLSIQVIDDEHHRTILGISTRERSFKKDKASCFSNKETALLLGQQMGKILLKSNIKEAVFDRSGYKYHGKVEKIATGIRESGIKI